MKYSPNTSDNNFYTNNDSLKMLNLSKKNNSGNLSKVDKSDRISNTTKSLEKVGNSNTAYNSMYYKPSAQNASNLQKDNPNNLKNFYYTKMMSKKLLEEAKNENQFINTRISSINEKNKAIVEKPKITDNYTNISHEYPSNNYYSRNETVDTVPRGGQGQGQGHGQGHSYGIGRNKRVSPNERDKHNKKSSENVLYNLLDSQFSVNSPSKKMVYQHELDKIKLNEEIRNRLQTANTYSSDEEGNTGNLGNTNTVSNNLNNINEFKETNLSYMGDNAHDKFLEAFEFVIVSLEESLFNTSTEGQIEILLDNTEDPRRMFR